MLIAHVFNLSWHSYTTLFINFPFKMFSVLSDDQSDLHTKLVYVKLNKQIHLIEVNVNAI